MTSLCLIEEAGFACTLPAAKLERLAEIARGVEWKAGTVIFREGDHRDELYILRSGQVALEMNVPGRGTTRILTVGPRELLAWSALLGDGRMTTCAIAVEPTMSIAISGDELRRLCQEDHEIGYHVMGQVASALSHRLLATRLQLLDLFARPN